MRVDQRKFAAALAAAGLTRGQFAALLGISRPTLDRRLIGFTPWPPREERLIRRILGVDAAWFVIESPAVVLEQLGYSTGSKAVADDTEDGAS